MCHQKSMSDSGPDKRPAARARYARTAAGPTTEPRRGRRRISAVSSLSDPGPADGPGGADSSDRVIISDGSSLPARTSGRSSDRVMRVEPVAWDVESSHAPRWTVAVEVCKRIEKRSQAGRPQLSAPNIGRPGTGPLTFPTDARPDRVHEFWTADSEQPSGARNGRSATFRLTRGPMSGCRCGSAAHAH